MRWLEVQHRLRGADSEETIKQRRVTHNKESTSFRGEIGNQILEIDLSQSRCPCPITKQGRSTPAKPFQAADANCIAEGGARPKLLDYAVPGVCAFLSQDQSTPDASHFETDPESGGRPEAHSAVGVPTGPGGRSDRDVAHVT